jgi:hypothetical protein
VFDAICSALRVVRRFASTTYVGDWRSIVAWPMLQ